MKKKIAIIISLATLFTICLPVLGFGNQEQTAKAEEVDQSDNLTLTQDELKSKMTNSIDNFDSAKGEFVYHSTAANFHNEVSYEVSNISGNHASKVTTVNTVLGEEMNYYFDGQTIAIVNNLTKTYTETPVSISMTEDHVSTLAYEDRITTTPNGEKVYMYREDPTYMASAGASLFPQEIAYSFLEDNSMWSIIGYENYLGRDTAVIEGSLDEYMSEKTQSTSFKMWIDTETGILLKYETYNESGEVMDYLVTSSITLDDPTINEIDYSYTIPEGYSENTTSSNVETPNECVAPYAFDDYVDNDDISGGSNDRSGFDTYVASAPSSFNGDHRLSSTSSSSEWYDWYSSVYLWEGTVHVFAFLDSADFVNTDAFYTYGVRSDASTTYLDQYAAGEGWNELGMHTVSVFPSNGQLFASVGKYSGMKTGADGIWFHIF